MLEEAALGSARVVTTRARAQVEYPVAAWPELFGETLKPVELLGGGLVMAGLALNIFGDWAMRRSDPAFFPAKIVNDLASENADLAVPADWTNGRSSVNEERDAITLSCQRNCEAQTYALSIVWRVYAAL
jgi:hypothetical protein